LLTVAKGCAACLQIAGKFGQAGSKLFGRFIELIAGILVELLAIGMQLVDILAQLREKVGKRSHGKTPVMFHGERYFFISRVFKYDRPVRAGRRARGT
jgi:hypothetical protein